ncbi:hypothetical protein GEV33_011130 [Tenebrio molitor]|uniref:Platelet-derived growth factor (PDGF) family profile domain-containing protein n=1 Tax=Tenebrio molitor TaxID=7067 RepID=A0A8J6HCE4_TENMO|nr:hypothetical protein GEV33_011130 [Tenebrio molitor]
MDVMVIFTIHIVCLTDCLAGRNKNCLPFALVDVCLLNNKKEEDETDDLGDSFDDYEDDVADNDDPFSDNEWQAEEATEPPVQAPVSSLTKYKWDNYGTRSRVEESRRQQLHLKPFNEAKATSAVIEHYMKVRQEGQCRRPHPRVISVQSEHPDPSKTYTPHCTILHRCAEDTGCCANFDTRCGPKTQVQVHLYFYRILKYFFVNQHVKSVGGVINVETKPCRRYNYCFGLGIMQIPLLIPEKDTGDKHHIKLHQSVQERRLFCI